MTVGITTAFVIITTLIRTVRVITAGTVRIIIRTRIITTRTVTERIITPLIIITTLTDRITAITDSVTIGTDIITIGTNTAMMIIIIIMEIIMTTEVIITATITATEVILHTEQAVITRLQTTVATVIIQTAAATVVITQTAAAAIITQTTAIRDIIIHRIIQTGAVPLTEIPQATAITIVQAGVLLRVQALKVQAAIPVRQENPQLQEAHSIRTDSFFSYNFLQC